MDLQMIHSSLICLYIPTWISLSTTPGEFQSPTLIIPRCFWSFCIDLVTDILSEGITGFPDILLFQYVFWCSGLFLSIWFDLGFMVNDFWSSFCQLLVGNLLSPPTRLLEFWYHGFGILGFRNLFDDASCEYISFSRKIFCREAVGRTVWISVGQG